MKSSIVLANAFAIVRAIGLQPDATNAAVNEFQLLGMSPRPTGHFDLFKRLSQDYTVCGFLNGDAQIPLDCAEVINTNAPCAVNTLSSWFGCCSTYTTRSGELAPASCPVRTSCVPYSQLSACSASSACISNTANRICSLSASPYCGSFVLKGASITAYNYFCDGPTTPAVLTILPLPTNAGGVIGSNSRSSSGGGGGLFSSPSTSSSGTFNLFGTPTPSSSTSRTTASSSSLAAQNHAVQTAAPLGVGILGAAMAVLNVL